MKYLVFFLSALGVPPLSALLCINMKWTRYVFWGIIAAMALFQATAINFFSREEYPGSARGMEVSLIYLLDIALLGALAVRGKIKKWFPDGGALRYAIYFILCLPSLFVADSLLISWFEIWKMMLIYLHFMAVYWYLRATDDVKSVFQALILFTVWNGFLVIKAHYAGVYQPGGVFPHRNGMAMGMTMLGPVFLSAYLTNGLRTWIGRLGAIALVFASVATLWSYSRGAIVLLPVAYGIATMACLWERKGTMRKFLRLSPLVLAGVIGFVAILPRIIDRFVNAPEKSGETRVELAACAWEMIHDHPLTGVGINNWSLNMDPVHPYQERASDRLGVELNYRGIVETVYLLVCAECGIPALVAMLCWFAGYWFLCVRLLRRLRGTQWFFIPAGFLGGLAVNYLQSTLEWVLRQQLNLVLLMFVFAILSYLNAASDRLAAMPELKRK